MPLAVGLQPSVVHIGIVAESGITQCLFAQIGDIPFVVIPQVNFGFFGRATEVHPELQDESLVDVKPLNLSGLFVHQLTFAYLASIIVTIPTRNKEVILFHLVLRKIH